MNGSYVMAADPGLMTGFAVLSALDQWNPDAVVAGQVESDAFCDWAAALPSGGLWLVETFTITAMTARLSQQPTALEVIGVLKFLARRNRCPVEMQLPADAKRFVTDKQLRKVGLWRPGHDHARDAIRHLILGIVTYGTGQVRDELIQSLA